MPLVGTGPTDARGGSAQVAAAGCTVGTVGNQASSQPAGTVISASVRPAGEVVDIVVAEAAPVGCIIPNVIG